MRLPMSRRQRLHFWHYRQPPLQFSRAGFGSATLPCCKPKHQIDRILAKLRQTEWPEPIGAPDGHAGGATAT